MPGSFRKPSTRLTEVRVACPQCGYANLSARKTCRACGAALHEPPAPPVETHPLPPPPTRASKRLFNDEDLLLLELVTARQRILIPIESSVILGRGGSFSTNPDRLIDLGPYGAQQLGVSRQHCQLQRREQRLLVTDLDSSNYTILNGERLIPYRPYVVAHGDHLLLGKLHLILYFRASQLD